MFQIIINKFCQHVYDTYKIYFNLKKKFLNSNFFIHVLKALQINLKTLFTNQVNIFPSSYFSYLKFNSLHSDGTDYTELGNEGFVPV